MHKCYHCGKGILYGRSHTHHRGVAGGRWKKRAVKTQRLFAPNLKKTYIVEKGKIIRVKLCTKCLKRIKKDIKDGVKPFITLARTVSRKPAVKDEKKKVVKAAKAVKMGNTVKKTAKS